MSLNIMLAVSKACCILLILLCLAQFFFLNTTPAAKRDQYYFKSVQMVYVIEGKLKFQASLFAQPNLITF